jgi:hypothetical protein
MKMNIRRPTAMILLLSGIKIESRIGATRGWIWMEGGECREVVQR